MQTAKSIRRKRRSPYNVTEQIERLLEQARGLYPNDIRQTISCIEEALKLARVGDQQRYIAVCYEKLGICYRAVQDVHRARHYLTMAVSQFDELPDKTISRALIHYNLGALDEYQGNFDAALDHYHTVLEHSNRDSGPEWMAAALSAIGDVHRQLGDYKAAAGALTQSLDVWKGIENLQGMAVSYQNIAIVYTQMNDWEEAIEALRQSLALYRQCGHTRGEALVLTSIGNYYVQQGNIAEGLDHLLAALRLDRDLGLIQQEVDTLISIGSAYEAEGNLEESLAFDLLALEKLNGTEFMALRPPVLAAIANVCLRLERFDEALDHAMQGLETALSLGTRGYESRLCRLIATASEKLGSPETALEYYKRYLQLHEDLTDQEARRAVVAIRTHADAEKVDREREEYRAKVVRLEQEIEYKTKELTALSLHLTRKDEMLRRLTKRAESVAQSSTADSEALDGLLAAIRGSSMDEAGWEAFERRLQEFQPEFLHTLSARCPSLTPMELKVCALLKMNMSSKDVSSILNIALYTVNTHRRNIRTKLELDSGANLTTFLTML